MVLDSILKLLAGLGALLLGFKLLSENTEKIASGGLKRMFNKTSKNPLIGILIGAGATAIIQSSGATTVMIVGFVNSGIMSLHQATAMIMGANIGTTITGQIASLKSLPVAEVAMALTCVGMGMDMFCKKDKLKTIGLLLAGLGLIFIGLDFMSSAMDAFREMPQVVNIFKVIKNPFLLLLIGAVITGVVQSSSAVTSILITMASAGFVIGNGGSPILYIVLGSNIGSTVTALMSSFTANVNGKRTAIIHLLFNTVGSLIYFIIFFVWDKVAPTSFMDMTFGKWFSDAGTQVAMFHTFFNLTCSIIFLPFIKVFVWLATKIYKDKEGEQGRVSHLDNRALRMPAVAIDCVKREINDTCALAMKTVNDSLTAFIEKDDSKVMDIREEIEQVNEMGKAITEYVVKVSTADLSYELEQEIGKFHYIIGDVVRVAELADNVVKHTEKAVKEDLIFSDEVKVDLRKMGEDLNNLHTLAMETFLSGSVANVDRVDELENNVDNMRRKLVQGHVDRLGEGKCQPQSSGVFINLVGNMERIGDHLHAIGLSVKGKIKDMF